MQAREGQVEADADPLPGEGGLQDEAAAEGRHVEGLRPSLRGELGLPHQGFQLRAAERLALAEGRRVDPRPDAAPVRRHDDDAPARRQDPPDLVQELATGSRRFRARAPPGPGRSRLRAAASSVGSTRAEAEAPDAGQFTTPCARRHEGERPLAFGAHGGEIGRRVAEADQAQGRRAGPRNGRSCARPGGAPRRRAGSRKRRADR